jgi:flagellar biosynthesis activator protein FlaF
MSVHKYQAAHVQTASPLSVEVMAFNRVTAALEQCARDAAMRTADATQRIERHVRLCDAVYQNSRLWITILDDLASPDNRLPQDLKQRLASLGATSMTHGRKVLAGQAMVQLLVDINRAIIVGLSQAREGKRPAAANQQEAAYVSSQA